MTDGEVVGRDGVTKHGQDPVALDVLQCLVGRVAHCHERWPSNVCRVCLPGEGGVRLAADLLPFGCAGEPVFVGLAEHRRVDLADPAAPGL